MTTQTEALERSQDQQTRRGAVVDAPRQAVFRLRRLLGRHLSVRWKLTLWYGLMIALTLGLTGVVMVAVLTHLMDSTIDGDLRTTADTMVSRLDRSSPTTGPYLTSSSCPVELQSYCVQVQLTLDRYSTVVSRPGQFEQVLIQPGQIAGESQAPAFLASPAAPQGVFISSVAISRVASIGAPQFIDVPTPDGAKLRAYLVKLQPPPELRGKALFVILAVFQDEHNYLLILHAVTVILLFAIPLGLLIALLAGWWIARAALRPIGRISRTVRSIGGSRDLSRRLDFVGPMDEVGRLAETFDGMMGRLENSFEAQKRFIADASHELRTPLTAIRGNADLFRIAPPEERDACVASIRRESERMSRMVADLLLLAEADVAEQVLQLQPIDLDDLLLDVYRSALVIAGDKVTVNYDPAESVQVSADPDRLKQVFLNLVDNAIKFTPVGGEVTIALHAQPDGARIEISDTGVGIPEAEQEAIFRRFYRVEHARSTHGSGLGLAICAWIVEAHHGTISVSSTPGHGSTFTVHLPADPTAADTEIEQVSNRE